MGNKTSNLDNDKKYIHEPYEKLNHSPNKKKIIISGGWGYGNIGDEVIALCTKHLVSKTFKDCEIIYTSYDKDEFFERYNVNTVSSVHSIIDDLPVEKINVDYILQHIEECGLKEYCDMFSDNTIFIMSGGGYFVGEWKNSFVSRILEIEIAKRAGAKVAIIGQSIGPVISTNDQKKLVNALNVCDYVSVRDQATINYLKSIGVEKNIHYYPDVAVICSDIIKPFTQRDVVCISPASYTRYQSMNKTRARYLFDKIINKHHILRSIQWRLDFARRRYFKEYKHLIMSLSERYQLLFVMSTEWETNNKFAEYLCEGVDENRYEIVCCKTAEELCNTISESRLIVSSKMHPLIIANSYGIPTIGISYNFKLDNFMKMINRSDGCVMINRLDHKELIELINKEMKQTNMTCIESAEFKGKVYEMMEDLSGVISE